MFWQMYCIIAPDAGDAVTMATEMDFKTPLSIFGHGSLSNHVWHLSLKKKKKKKLCRGNISLSPTLPISSLFKYHNPNFHNCQTL